MTCIPLILWKVEKTIQELVNIGLSENEAALYLAALSLGTTTVLKLAKYSEVNRTTAYEVIESLEKKGLMKKEIKGLKTLYAPEHPERLENALEKKRATLVQLLPELEGKFKLKGKGSSIKCYEGLAAVKNLYDDLLDELRPGDFYYVISNTAEWQAIDSDYFMKNHIARLPTMRINRNVLFVDSKEARRRKETERNFNEHVRILPKDSNIHVDMCSTPYKLVFFQLHEPLAALVVENQTMINTQKEVFEMLWKTVSE
jgi:sugar-specific transcriptional regulator TrmB